MKFNTYLLKISGSYSSLFNTLRKFHLNFHRNYPLLSGNMTYICDKQLPPFSYIRFTKCYSTLKKSFISSLTENIDIEELKEQMRKQRNVTSERISIKEFVATEINKRYSKAIESFNQQETKALKVITLEHSFLFHEGYDIPPAEEMENKHWLEALTFETIADRLVYYLSLQDMKRYQVSIRNDRENLEDLIHNRNADGDSCGIILDYEIPDRLLRWHNNRLASAMQFGIPLIIDMGFTVSTPTELIPLSQQLWELYCTNRSHPDPYHLVFTNCTPSHPVYRYLELHHLVETMFILATFTDKNHLQLFPTQEKVYLSAQAKQALIKYDPNTIYIMGAYHDPLVRNKESFARAKEQKLPCMRLPIDEHVKWRHQIHKDLDINLVVDILLSVKQSKSWKTAFQTGVPHMINQIL
ncbi:unnamed protein product [Lymnaea stagnalis]|uniref:RNA (guanine-9-)-methyltransferase domain-containing protein 1 n=1 Tax=Lymnaea stagnalis TaxID=6523 RepID=A0AAV2HPW2_LYMST